MARAGRSLRGCLIGNLLMAAVSMAVLLGIVGALLVHRVADLFYDRLLDGSLQTIADRLAIESGEVLRQAGLRQFEGRRVRGSTWTVAVKPATRRTPCGT